jgi:hypothetical protein
MLLAFTSLSGAGHSMRTAQWTRSTTTPHQAEFAGTALA